MPGELVHRPAPDDGLLAAVAEDHDEGIERRRPVGVAEVDVSEFAPVALGLGPGWGLDPAERADRWPAVAGADELADRLVGAVVGVLGLEEFVEEQDAGRPLLSQGLGLGVPPVGDGVGQSELLDPRGLPSAIGGRVAGASEVVADRPLGDAQDARRLALRLTALLQDLDRHDLLPCERCQGAASERVLDVRDPLGSAWHACRWISNTTAVLDACQARNDSGSLTPSFTGLVTVRGEMEQAATAVDALQESLNLAEAERDRFKGEAEALTKQLAAVEGTLGEVRRQSESKLQEERAQTDAVRRESDARDEKAQEEIRQMERRAVEGETRAKELQSELLTLREELRAEREAREKTRAQGAQVTAELSEARKRIDELTNERDKEREGTRSFMEKLEAWVKP